MALVPSRELIQHGEGRAGLTFRWANSVFEQRSSNLAFLHLSKSQRSNWPAELGRGWGSTVLEGAVEAAIQRHPLAVPAQCQSAPKSHQMCLCVSPRHSLRELAPVSEELLWHPGAWFPPYPHTPRKPSQPVSLVDKMGMASHNVRAASSPWELLWLFSGR